MIEERTLWWDRWNRGFHGTRYGRNSEGDPCGDFQLAFLAAQNPTFLWKEEPTVFLCLSIHGSGSEVKRQTDWGSSSMQISNPFFSRFQILENFNRTSINFQMVIGIGPILFSYRDQWNPFLLFHHTLHPLTTMHVSNPLPGAEGPALQPAGRSRFLPYILAILQIPGRHHPVMVTLSNSFPPIFISIFSTRFLENP